MASREPFFIPVTLFYMQNLRECIILNLIVSSINRNNAQLRLKKKLFHFYWNTQHVTFFIEINSQHQSYSSFDMKKFFYHSSSKIPNNSVA